MSSLFFSADPTLIITVGLTYCIGESGFGTQLSPNPATGKPITTGPYPPFPPVSMAIFATFNFKAAHDPSIPNNSGVAINNAIQANGPFGTLNSGGGSSFNNFQFDAPASNPGYNLNLVGSAVQVPQSVFTSLSFTDATGPRVLTSASATYFHLGGATPHGFWNWTLANGTPQQLIAGNIYNVVVT